MKQLHTNCEKLFVKNNLLSGKVTDCIGNVMYSLSMDDGTKWKRHIDRIRNI